MFLLVGCVQLLLLAGGCANKPPTLNCIPDRTSVIEGDSVSIQSNAQDPDRNDRLNFNWSAGSGKLTAQNGTAVFDSTGLSPGTYSVDLEVRDSKQNAAKCALDLTVEKRKLSPTISCESARVSVTEGESTTLQASASDPNDDPLTYSWTVDAEDVRNNQLSFEFGTEGRSIGAHAARVTVTDVDGMTASCDFSVIINRRPNVSPTVSLALSKNEVYAGEKISAEAQADDPDGDPLTYSWTLDGQSRSEASPQIQIDTGSLAGGSHSVSVTVEDDREGSASDTQSFSVREKVVIQMDRSRPDNIAKAKLDEIALKMQQNPQLRALIVGHTDDRGSESGNERMGLRRADAAKGYLVEQQQIDQSRVETRSAGESQPMADNQTPEGQKENRRVEIELFVP
jgi:outer membrane protein OmpA-like peptidoglycan-associated protein